MNNYPEWLVEKVARRLGGDDWEDWQSDAVTLLSALGFGPWGGPTYWRSSIQWEHDV